MPIARFAWSSPQREDAAPPPRTPLDALLRCLAPRSGSRAPVAVARGGDWPPWCLVRVSDGHTGSRQRSDQAMQPRRARAPKLLIGALGMACPSVPKAASLVADPIGVPCLVLLSLAHHRYRLPSPMCRICFVSAPSSSHQTLFPRQPIMSSARRPVCARWPPARLAQPCREVTQAGKWVGARSVHMSVMAMVMPDLVPR